MLNALYLCACIFWDWSFSKRIEALTLSSPTYQYIILGNSLAMDGIDPEILASNSKSAYNLAIGGSSLKTNLIQLEDYLKIAKENPKVVILALGSYINDFQRQEINPVVEFTMEGHHYGLKDLPMIKFRWLVYELIKKVIDPDHRNAKLYQGQLRIGRTVNDDSKYASPLNALPINDYINSEYIKKIADRCRASNIHLVLIEMPGFKRTQNQTDIGPHKISLDDKAPIYLYNLNNIEFASKFDSEKDWLGNSHLNEFGAVKFTTYLKEIIKI